MSSVSDESLRGGRELHRINAALRSFGMIGDVASLGHAVLGIGWLMRGRHDPVLQGQVLEPIWLEQRI